MCVLASSSRKEWRPPHRACRDSLPTLLSQRAQKKNQDNINSRLALVMKSGKSTLGYKTCLKTLRSGKGELFLDGGRNTHTHTLWAGTRRWFAFPGIPGS